MTAASTEGWCVTRLIHTGSNLTRLWAQDDIKHDVKVKLTTKHGVQRDLWASAWYTELRKRHNQELKKWANSSLQSDRGPKTGRRDGVKRPIPKLWINEVSASALVQTEALSLRSCCCTDLRPGLGCNEAQALAAESLYAKQGEGREEAIPSPQGSLGLGCLPVLLERCKTQCARTQSM